MKIITPENHEHWLNLRMEDVTSTESPALFGLSPYSTEFELWHRKANQEFVAFEENERMKWGNRLESAIAEGIAEDNNWTVKPFKEYARDEELRAGSSFDFIILNDEPNQEEGLNKLIDLIPVGLLEIKNVDSLQFRDKWIIEDGEVIEAPPHIEIQCQHQLMVTGFPRLYIGALVGGNSVKLIERTPDKEIIGEIKKRISDFWDSIEKGIEPKPNFERDAEFVSSLYNMATPGKIIEPDSNPRFETLVQEYKRYGEMEKEAGKRKQAAKAEMLTMVGDAEKVRGEGYTISAGVVGPSQVSYIRKGYRNFRVHFKKEK